MAVKSNNAPSKQKRIFRNRPQPLRARVVNTLDPTIGFQRGLEPHHIQGATFSNDKLMFVIVWKNPETAEPITDNNMLDVVFATEVYEKYPQLAISFFEDRIEFH